MVNLVYVIVIKDNNNLEDVVKVGYLLLNKDHNNLIPVSDDQVQVYGILRKDYIDEDGVMVYIGQEDGFENFDKDNVIVRIENIYLYQDNYNLKEIHFYQEMDHDIVIEVYEG